MIRKNKKGFTLIEVLAVIMILGILLLIAVPSISEYIMGTKRNTYIATAKSLANGASIFLKNQKMNLNNKDVTYYIPTECFDTDNETTSPYGKFDPAYVVVTYDANRKTNDYYWTSTDETGMGIINITRIDDLDVNQIESGVKKKDISTDRSIDGRSTIYEFDSTCKNVVKKEPNYYGNTRKSCTYDGELYQGATFTDGQFTYKYMQEGAGSTYWNNMSEDGWGVMLTDKNSSAPVTTELCTEISGKKVVSTSYMFYYSRTTDIDTSSYDTGFVKNMKYMFYGTYYLHNLDVSSFVTRAATDMNYMFGYSYNLESIKFGKGFIPASDISYMFYYDYRLTNLDSLKYWDTSRVTNMQYMFYYDYGLTNLDSLKDWDMSNVTNMQYMFYYCYGLANIDFLKDWNVSNVNNMNYLFYYLYKVDSIEPLRNWDVSSLTNMRYLFYRMGITSLEPIKNWKLDSATNLDYLFYYVDKVEDFSPITKWDTSKITSMQYTFAYTTIKNVDTLKNLNVSNVHYANGLFYYCRNLRNIEGMLNLNTSNFEKLDYMFYNDSYLITHYVIGRLDLRNATSLSYMCYGNSELDNLSAFYNFNIPKVTTVRGMFGYCYNIVSVSAFNTWYRPSLTDISYLFYRTKLSNLNDLTDLDLTNITNISYLFASNTNLYSLNAIANWDVSGITNMAGLFSGTKVSDSSNINDWDITHVIHPDRSSSYSANGSYAGFMMMFQDTPNHPTFTRKSGCWDYNGTFVPNGTACQTVKPAYTGGGGCLDGEMEVVVYDEEKKKRLLKKLKDITYKDLILVWDFDLGDYAFVRPFWIMTPHVYHESVLLTFDDNSTLKVIGDHKIYNDDLKKFTSARSDEETPIGTNTINVDGKTIKLISKEIIEGDVYAYNVISDKHINIFANGILTSRGSNNIYKINNMKFIKEPKETFTREELSNIPDEYFYGLRLNERPIDYNGTKEETKKDIERLVEQLIKEKK